MAVPNGWPSEVPDPVVADWERHAVAWLFDQCPPDYRGYDVFRSHPIVLAHLARSSLKASLEATDTGLRSARHDLRHHVTPETIAVALTAYEHERHRLRAASVGADLIWRALSGERWAARL